MGEPRPSSERPRDLIGEFVFHSLVFSWSDGGHGPQALLPAAAGNRARGQSGEQGDQVLRQGTNWTVSLACMQGKGDRGMYPGGVTRATRQVRTQWGINDLSPWVSDCSEELKRPQGRGN